MKIWKHNGYPTKASRPDGESVRDSRYIGRLAPTPSGRLHKGHAFTFAIAYFRARKHPEDKIFLRIEDLDLKRCKEVHVSGILEDLQWLGIRWDATSIGSEGFLRQSALLESYQEVLIDWIEAGWIYPSNVSRKMLQGDPSIKKSLDGAYIFPESFREPFCLRRLDLSSAESIFKRNWRWRVEYGSHITFRDNRLGLLEFTAGQDFGDFLVWSRDGYPSYEMAVVLDDIRQGITEVVRGEDLLVSTARQLQLYSVLGNRVPDFYHCPLAKDEKGIRLAKSFDSESIQSYRKKGYSPNDFWAELAEHGYPEVAEWLNRH